MFHILRISTGLCAGGASKFIFLHCVLNDNALLVHAVKAYGMWRYNPLILDLGTVRRSGQLYAMAAVLQGKGSQLHIECETGWAPKPTSVL